MRSGTRVCGGVSEERPRAPVAAAEREVRRAGMPGCSITLAHWGPLPAASTATIGLDSQADLAVGVGIG
eukprot:366391-Chlamydomonas_euryale.AAC.40